MELKNLAIIQGSNTEIKNGRIFYKPTQVAKDIKQPPTKSRSSKTKNIDSKLEANSKLNLVNIRSDYEFSEGTIELKFKATTPESGVLFVFQTQDGNGIVIGHSSNHESFIMKEDYYYAEPNASVSRLSNLEYNESVHMKVVVKGSQVQLFINNILFIDELSNIKKAPIEIRLSSYKGELEIYDFKVYATKPKLFVIMQFSKEYNDLYEEVIKPIVEQENFECIRADEFYTATPILKDIIENIESSKAIIAEITPDNPNVFYEIGYSHAIKKPTILLCDHKREKLPFDISSFRTLFYENSIVGKKKVESSLIKYLEQIK